MNKKGLTFLNNSMGIYVMAVPINTILIVIIIGVTLFFVIVDIKRHSNEIVSITLLAIKKAMKNLNNTTSLYKKRIPL